jgi:hypothetical protein
MKILLLVYGIALPFFALGGYLCIELGKWRSYDFGVIIAIAILFIALAWKLLKQPSQSSSPKP